MTVGLTQEVLKSFRIAYDFQTVALGSLHGSSNVCVPFRQGFACLFPYQVVRAGDEMVELGRSRRG